ncbi:MAG TPA: ABC transporter ATP-binding protein [Candidatus Latescibacteria bacterium]|nr:ABC transporter ATP-binding protein [Candidatus Latescibacterota bacterium]
MLRLRNLSAYYGRVQALHHISLHVGPGEIVCLIGANGAGKTTTLRAISGLVRTEGQILYDGRDLRELPPERIVEMGIAHVPEGRQLFPDLTVLDHLRLGAYLRRKAPKRELEQDIEALFELFPTLRERADQLAGTLSGGEGQMLAIARALMARPQLLLLDEPSLGLAPMLVRDIFRTIRKLSDDGLTVLLVEQNARLALEVSNRGYVLETGRIVLEGSTEELLGNREVQRAYLGKGREGFLEGIRG